MIDKKELRRFYRSVRKSQTSEEKNCFDKKIFSFLINSSLYKNASKILVYVSVNDEADTIEIIRYALNDGKTVAVPFCVDDKMEFLIINSLSDLSEGKFGIPTADPEKCAVLSDFEGALCVVPALSFDIYGNRLGYGGGLYDRFLNRKNVVSLGLTYERCLCGAIPREKHDIKIDYILTEKCLRNSKKEVST
jgi:5-formyltetrahydrofolate cyclo-ligase